MLRSFLLVLILCNFCNFLAQTGPIEASEQAQAAILLGDEAWTLRADESEGRTAQSGPVDRAIAAYETALEQAPESIRARQRLLRALYFKGEYVARDAETRLQIYTLGREIADAGRALIYEQAGISGGDGELDPSDIVERVREIDDAEEIFFWSATHWGLWGRYRGKVAAARQGVANKVRDFGEVSVALNEKYEKGGGHRILGRLHTEAPKIPFVTGWIDRDFAVSELRRAVEIAPNDLLNRLYLAEALLEFEPKAKLEALEILQGLVEHRPDFEARVEETAVIEDARLLLSSNSAD